MRVLFVENAGNYNAGAYHSLVNLILLLRKYNVESYVVLPDRADGIDMLILNNIPHITLRACSYTWGISDKASWVEKIKMPFKHIVVRHTAIKLADYIKNNAIDIVHENTSACYMGAYATRITNVKHVWHIREFMEEDFGVHIWNRKKAMKLMNSADAIITISQVLFDKYKKDIDNNKMHRIYNGIRTDIFFNNVKKDFEIGILRVLCVGRVCEGKGQFLLVEAAGLLHRDYQKRIEVILAGTYDKKAYDKIMDIANMYGISENISMLGQQNDMRSVYGAAEIFCMASRCEAFGRVTIEAMMSGCAVIGANSGGTKEIIENGKNGILFDSGNVVDLARKLDEMLSDRKRISELAMQGQQDAIKRFDAQRNADEVYSLYNELLQNNK